MNAIGEIRKNATEVIRVGWSEYKGHHFLDMRVYFEDDSGNWRPTKKGIAIPPEQLAGIMELLAKAEQSEGK
ncbi:transcriptional coactivator p15 [Candidatus Woesearchaeota archaeon]|nr:MAG: transcriptional coactivator p15 [Candidatus Woesearchaeota archaeon]